jgi:hypothetical protein
MEPSSSIFLSIKKTFDYEALLLHKEEILLQTVSNISQLFIFIFKIEQRIFYRNWRNNHGSSTSSNLISTADQTV